MLRHTRNRHCLDKSGVVSQLKVSPRYKCAGLRLCTVLVSPRVPAICSVDWSSRWGRRRPGCPPCRQAWPELWSCWTEPEPRPPAGTSGCSGCTHSFPQTVSTGRTTHNIRAQVRLGVTCVCTWHLDDPSTQIHKILASEDTHAE